MYWCLNIYYPHLNLFLINSGTLLVDFHIVQHLLNTEINCKVKIPQNSEEIGNIIERANSSTCSMVSRESRSYNVTTTTNKALGLRYQSRLQNVLSAVIRDKLITHADIVNVQLLLHMHYGIEFHNASMNLHWKPGFTPILHIMDS